MTTGFQQQQMQHEPLSRANPRPKHGGSFARPEDQAGSTAPQEPRTFKPGK